MRGQCLAEGADPRAAATASSLPSSTLTRYAPSKRPPYPCCLFPLAIHSPWSRFQRSSHSGGLLRNSASSFRRNRQRFLMRRPLSSPRWTYSRTVRGRRPRIWAASVTVKSPCLEFRLSTGREVLDLTLASLSAVRAPEESRVACSEPGYFPAGLNLPPGQRQPVLRSPALPSRLFVLVQQSKGSEEESPDLLVTGLTGLGLAPPTKFGSAPAGADPLAGPEWLAADGTEMTVTARGEALHKRTCGFGRDLSC